jgi:hypothetical protein
MFAQALGWKYFMIFVCTNLTNALVAFLLFPETKNKTLEEIGLLFGDENVRVMPGYEGRATVGDGEREKEGDEEKGEGGMKEDVVHLDRV